MFFSEVPISILCFFFRQQNEWMRLGDQLKMNYRKKRRKNQIQTIYCIKCSAIERNIPISNCPKNEEKTEICNCWHELPLRVRRSGLSSDIGCGSLTFDAPCSLSFLFQQLMKNDLLQRSGSWTMNAFVLCPKCRRIK